MHWAIKILMIFAVFALASCGQLTGGQGSTPAQLDGTEWNLQSLNGQAPLEGSQVTLKFEGENVSGSAGCNSYGGSYQVDGNQLNMAELFQTEMACMEPAGVMEQESAYLQALGSADRYEVTEGMLTIFNAAGEEVLTFTAE